MEHFSTYQQNFSNNAMEWHKLMNEHTENNKMTMTRFTEMMHNISGAMMLGGQTLISAFFVIVILILVLFVEIQRVAHGIELFEKSTKLAYLGAFVLVMMLLTLEFVIHYIESKTGYHQQRKRDFSFRLMWQWLVYVSGFGDTWQERLKSPAQSIKTYSRLLTMTILALALGGSMSEALASVSGNWIQGLQTIALESSLLEIVEWTGGLLFALALVIGAQRLTAYVAQRAAETLSQSSDGQSIDDTEAIEADYAVTVDLPANDQQALPFIEATKMIQNVSANPLLPTVDLGHIASCPDCGWTSTPKDTEANANRALSMHQRKCEVCNQVEVTS